MFSVGASPFNGVRRATYGGAIWRGPAGGWVSNATTDSTVASLGWGQSAQKFYQDTKWASMAQKYSVDPVERTRAKHVKDIAKNYLKLTREAARRGDDIANQWLDDYRVALRATRSPYRFSSLPASQRQAVYRSFLTIPYNSRGLTNAQRLFLQMGNRAPFAALPALPAGITAADSAALQNMVVNNPNYYELTDTMRREGAISRYGLTGTPFDYAALLNPAPAPAPAQAVPVQGVPVQGVAPAEPVDGMG